MFNLESSNPALKAARGFEAALDETATVQGVIDKTILMTGLTVVAGLTAYAVLPATWTILLTSCLVSLVFGVGVAWHLNGNPMQSARWTPVYAVVEGVFLGLVTKALDGLLASTGYAGGSLALPALILTVSCGLSMLTLYRAKLIRPTQTFRAVVGTLTAAVFVAYLAMFVLQLMGVSAFPHLSIKSALAGGSMAMIGLGLNALILILASLWFVIDFAEIEKIVEEGKPPAMEWFGTFMLLTTLTWVYFEAVRLMFRIAAMTSSD